MAADQDPLGLCGKTLGKFEIQALLGAGGFGAVYRACDTLLKRSVALKILSPQDATRSDLVERFLREARMAAKLDHPNIVRVHQVGAQEGYYYIEMEIVEGRSVAELIEEHSQGAAASKEDQMFRRPLMAAETFKEDCAAAQGLPQAQVLGLAEQMADALQAAHYEANFIHRDLKPSNVLVTDAGVVKIVDFGLAKPLREGPGASLCTTGGIFLGTIAYASPEQCRGETPDCRSDIYSFGATLYHMLSGVPPIPPAKEENELQLLNRIQTEAPVPVQQRVPGLDGNLCAIVMKMLAKQPGDRYPSVRAVRHDLKAVKEGGPLSQSIVGGQTRRVPLQRILTPRDEALVSVAQELGYLTPEQVWDSKASFDAVLQAGTKVSLDRLLLDKKYLTRGQLKRVVAELHSRGFHPAIGQYDILSKLGAGGTATVYKARDRRTGRIVALKVLARAMAADGLTAERFLRGALLAAKVEHPNIVHVFASGQDGQDYFLAMEYVEGAVLSTKATPAAPLPEREALNITRQIASGLAACHAQSIVHRDVKPSNILVTAQGLAKLTDLGIAREIEPAAADVTLDGHTVGTPHYMSPEQCASSKDVDARSDIYSLGATLFFMLTGQTPFHGATILDVMKEQTSSPLPNPRQFNPAVSDMTHALLWKMMSKAPAGRPQTAEELIAAIEAVERTLPGGDQAAGEMQELLSQIAEPAKREKLGRSILRRVKAIDRRLEAVKKFSAVWRQYAAFMKREGEGAVLTPQDEEAFAALKGRISGEYMSVLPLLERPDRGGPVIKHCGQDPSLSATAHDRQSPAALEKGCEAGAKLLHDFQAFLEQSRRRTISESFLRYNMAKYVGTPQRQIAAVFGLALAGFLGGWLLIAQLYGKAAGIVNQQAVATTPPAGMKLGPALAQPEAAPAQPTTAKPATADTTAKQNPAAVPAPTTPAPAKQEPGLSSFVVTRAFGRQLLDLSNTKATDADLAALKNWQDFVDLNLSGTRVTDAGLAALEGKELHSLHIDGTLVTDTGLAHLKAMAKLEWLDLSNSKAADGALARVAGLKNLSGLLLQNCAWVTDANVSDLKEMTNLNHLSLSGTRITDAGLESLAALKGLHLLYLTNTRITDAGVRRIKEFKHLGRLELSGTKITDAGLADLKELKELTTVLLYKNPQLTRASLAGLKAALPPKTQVWTDGGLVKAVP